MEANTIMTTRRATPPRGFTTNQLMIGAITYAVINRAAKIKIMRNKRIANISPTFSNFTVPVCYDCLDYTFMLTFLSLERLIIGYLVCFFYML